VDCRKDGKSVGRKEISMQRLREKGMRQRWRWTARKHRKKEKESEAVKHRKKEREKGVQCSEAVWKERSWMRSMG
jgi:hypothetical protein